MNQSSVRSIWIGNSFGLLLLALTPAVVAAPPQEPPARQDVEPQFEFRIAPDDEGGMRYTIELFEKIGHESIQVIHVRNGVDPAVEGNASLIDTNGDGPVRPRRRDEGRQVVQGLGF